LKLINFFSYNDLNNFNKNLEKSMVLIIYNL
jgi:hypothetical protein